MKAKVKWIDEMQMQGTTESGHSLIMDGSNPGNGASPMEMVLMAAGGCSTIDVVSILQKARQEISDCQVEIDSERADSTPRVFTKIHLHFIVTGNKLSEKQVARAVELSMEKYCSVSLMLEKALTISHSYVIEQLAPQQTV
ncbi:OsmC family protein [Dongshaea marina]|uniref:OsmC family protein n=1 Tax=Dongshaea marina TaxID=2047966 RepID=UPI000D3EA550|nr:OsmC family protein [Dongshaea marina]